MNLIGDEGDDERKEDAIGEHVQFLDDKSLLLIMKEAVDNGRKTLKVIRGHYSGKGKPRVILLYTQLTILKKEL